MMKPLLTLLRTKGPLAEAQIAHALGLDATQLQELVAESAGGIFVSNSSSGGRYAARRPIRGSILPFPIWRIDANGTRVPAAVLHPVMPSGYWLEQLFGWEWPLPEESAAGWFEGLPYPLLGLFPQGFLGQDYARAVAPALGTPAEPSLWTDEDLLFAISKTGVDLQGNLLVGQDACEQWDACRADCPENGDRLTPRPTHFQARIQSGAGSSSKVPAYLGGEFAKCLTEAVDTKITSRSAWEFHDFLLKVAPQKTRAADLLVCEHLAGLTLRDELGVATAVTQVRAMGSFTALRVVRDDRKGPVGRIGRVALAALNNAVFASAGDAWPVVARRLVEQGWLSVEDERRIALSWCFGALIGNNDMHEWNLEFEPAQDAGGAGLRLAPVYDMLPMLYANKPGQAESGWQLPCLQEIESKNSRFLATADWQRCVLAARQFWEQASNEPRLSEEFKAICLTNSRELA